MWMVDDWVWVGRTVCNILKWDGVEKRVGKQNFKKGVACWVKGCLKKRCCDPLQTMSYNGDS